MGKEGNVGPIQFGIALGGYDDEPELTDRLLRTVELAEALGLESAWVGDHIVWRDVIVDPMPFLGACAVRTHKIRLGTGILLLPLRNPVVVAKEVATLDRLSKGRMNFGVGVGGEQPKEFEACGIPLTERGARTDEGIRVIRALWRGPRASFSGKFSRFEDVTIQPTPVQLGGPPIWIGGRTDAALKRAATIGDGYIGYLLSTRRYRESVRKIREFAEAERRDPAEIGFGLYLFTLVGENRAQARALIEADLTRRYAQSFEGMIDRFCAFGTPQDCIKTIAEFVEAGVRHVVFRHACSPSELPNQLEICAREILPYFRKDSHVP